jgi:hypothetical protein
LSLVTVFEIAYRIAVNKKGLSGLSISREYEVNQKTADKWHQKIQSVMVSSENFPLQGIVHVDDFFIGGKDKSKRKKQAEAVKQAKQEHVLLLK